MHQAYDAVIWDFGGVISSSPFEAFADFERRRGLPEGFLRRVNSANPHQNAWARLERDAISLDAFDEAFACESLAFGHALRGREVLPLLAGEIRPAMVQALRCVKTLCRTACITNTIPGFPAVRGQGRQHAESGDPADPPSRSVPADPPSRSDPADLAVPADARYFYRPEVMALFDVVIESAVVGVRKPDPEIYRMAMHALAVAPERCIYLDDLGVNLKPARAMGMQTIKVVDPGEAIAALSALLGIPLTG